MLFYFLLTSSNIYSVDINSWHAHLGHIGQDKINRLARDGQQANINLLMCKQCLVNKNTRKTFGKGTRAEFPLQLVHSNICGPMNVRTK